LASTAHADGADERQPSGGGGEPLEPGDWRGYLGDSGNVSGGALRLGGRGPLGAGGGRRRLVEGVTPRSGRGGDPSCRGTAPHYRTGAHRTGARGGGDGWIGAGRRRADGRWGLCAGRGRGRARRWVGRASSPPPTVCPRGVGWWAGTALLGVGRGL